MEDVEQFIRKAGSDDIPTFGGDFEGGIHCQQIPDELAPCITAILDSGEAIDNYLEIGAAAGGTAFIINHFFPWASIVLVDDNKHSKAPLRAEILHGIAHQELVGSSGDAEVIASAEQEGLYDLILIDGDHNYPGVKADVDNYLPMLRPGGFLILHDSAKIEWGVGQVVTELKADKGMEFVGEYVSPTHPSPCGCALFRKAVA